MEIPSMRFAVVRSNAPGCEPNCPEWISAEGTIEADTPGLLKRTLKALKGRQCRWSSIPPAAMSMRR